MEYINQLRIEMLNLKGEEYDEEAPCPECEEISGECVCKDDLAEREVGGVKSNMVGNAFSSALVALPKL